MDNNDGVTDRSFEATTQLLQQQENSTISESLDLGLSDLSEVPVKYQMQPDDLYNLMNQLQGSDQEALATRYSAMPVEPTTNAEMAEANPKDTSCTKPSSASQSAKIPNDTYSWRKYGQKQVKSPEGSRSYFKCTHSACHAKKLESSDQFNSITKIVYRGQHKHDPPKRVVSEKIKIILTPKSPILTPGLKEHRAPIQVEHIDDSQLKQRVKKNSSASPGSVLNRPKKPKFIVDASADTHISADGYRWRKYGQKMVKGNPHPRNYYKCTSAGCPVTKYIEKVTDGSSKVLITYKCVHDHDVPVPKKRQAPPSYHGTDVYAASNISKFKRRGHNTEEPKTRKSPRTLLSVGFEIKHR